LAISPVATRVQRDNYKPGISDNYKRNPV
jgi:hypothetical protein